MPYAYCPKCGYEFGFPSYGDILAGGLECPRCFTIRPIDDYEKRLLGDEIAERLDTLERRVFSSEE